MSGWLTSAVLIHVTLEDSSLVSSLAEGRSDATSSCKEFNAMQILHIGQAWLGRKKLQERDKHKRQPHLDHCVHTLHLCPLLPSGPSCL